MKNCANKNGAAKILLEHYRRCMTKNEKNRPLEQILELYRRS